MKPELELRHLRVFLAVAQQGGHTRAGRSLGISQSTVSETLSSLVLGARPEVVVHELTSIPRVMDVKRYAEEFAPNNRVRIEGTRNLVAAALAAGTSILSSSGRASTSSWVAPG